jgi:hypothetical protein
MSKRVVEVGQSWSFGDHRSRHRVGLYSALFSLVTFLCLYVPA